VVGNKGKLPGKELDGTWPAWLKENLERKCDPAQLLEILLKNGFALHSIRAHMGSSFPDTSPLASTDYQAIASVRLTRADSGLNVQAVPVENVQLYTLEEFMTEAECDHVANIAAAHLRPSTVTTGEYGYRTSSTSDLSLLNDPYIKALDERIARTVGIQLPYSEGIQAQRYEIGQEFREHTDYFEEGTQEYATYAGDRGQRTWTFMVYLNDCPAGGGTSFLRLNKIFLPRTGMALIWNNLTVDGKTNPATLHAGLPIEAGHKIIITKWFRTRGTGPMFY
jgi:prolyl 4-hydroxylase